MCAVRPRLCTRYIASLTEACERDVDARGETVRNNALGKLGPMCETSGSMDFYGWLAKLHSKSPAFIVWALTASVKFLAFTLEESDRCIGFGLGFVRDGDGKICGALEEVRACE